jgi:exosortase
MSAVVGHQPPVGVGPNIWERWRVNWAFTVLEAVLWVWSILVCIPYWSRVDSDYAYGWAVPFGMFFFLWRRLGAQSAEFWQQCGQDGHHTWKVSPWLLALPGLGLFPLEVYREEYFQSGIVLWTINLAKVAFSMAGAWWLGGRRLLLLTLFPLLFFLTAVPWPAKLAQPFQQNLMIGVAAVVHESLLWLDVPARLEGAVLHLTKGTVGIVEACSGIRSLQSGLMIALAVGELMWLSRIRRTVLVVLAITLALVSNFARTFTLAWIVEHEGSEAMQRAHDTVGNIAMYSFYALIFVIGTLLARGTKDIWPRKDVGTWAERVSQLSWTHVPDFRPLLGLTLGLFATVHVWYAVLEWRAQPQTEPQFTAIVDASAGVARREFDPAVWGQLGATQGDSLEIKAADSPMGQLTASHLFWRPSSMSRTALHHRPDVCMPGSGWKQVGDVTNTTVVMEGVPLKFLVFQFERSDVKALMLWSVWRNGQPVDFDFSDKYTALPERYGMVPTDRHMLGVELVSCFVPYREGTPPLEVARRELPKRFKYQPYRPSR